VNFLNGIEVFVQVVELSSFTRTAQVRNVTPGMISTQITELEKELGVRLLHRSTRKLSVTDEGRVLYKRFKKIVDDVHEVKGIYAQPTVPSGKVRIIGGTVTIHCLMLPLVQEFSQRHPDVTLEFFETGQVFGAKNDEHDLVLRYPPLDDSNLVARPLGTSRMVVAGSPAYLQGHGEPEDPEDLLMHRCLGYIDRGSGRLTEWTLSRDGKMFSMYPTRSHAFNNAASLVEAGIHDLGLIYVPDIYIHKAVAQGLLKPVLTDASVLLNGPYVLYQQGQLLPRRVRVFLDFLFETYSPEKPLLTSLLAHLNPSQDTCGNRSPPPRHAPPATFDEPQGAVAQ
jgi:DNA-binding transcriptional LysR family regulator